jgi:predicted helicase
MDNIRQEITRYITEIGKIYRAGNATEHSYRPALKSLMDNITIGLTVTNEPRHIACGAPDYIITRDGIPLGYIEAKDISVGLDNKASKEQFDRYKKSLGNLIITDYLAFQLFAGGNHVASVTIARESGGGIAADKNQYGAFIELVNQFTGYSGKTIYQSLELARMMAAKAKLLAEVIRNALAEKDGEDSVLPGDTLSGQLEGFRKVLMHNLSETAFADMYAQTLAYGLFAARLNQHDAQTFNRATAAHLVPKSNPFLRKFFQYIAGFDLDTRIRWIVDALADLFNSVAVEDILKEFGKANQDPYIHFYETFLAEYDPALREGRGVYYTPLPVVQFIVQAVDDILKKEFGLAQGLADNSKIKMPVKRTDKKGNTIVAGEREFHKVQILDPASGTGTFLAEIINTIYHSYFAAQKGMWAGYCREHLIPRLNGFEILMASYAMAHFKLDMTLKETSFASDGDLRLKVYLTNTLEEPEDEASKLPMVEWLTQEANEANGIKKDTPVMVILGNPPYSGESANFTKDDFLAAHKMEPGGKEKLKEKNSKWINDDYVKFIRYGQNFIEKYGGGVLAFINNHSFLDNPTFRGMRWNMLKTFDKIYILDLHGNVKKKETAPGGGKDENVFDIQQGVSVNIFIKTGKKKDTELANILHSDIFGERERKYTLLLENTIKSIKWEKIKPAPPYFFFAPKDFSGEKEYAKGFGIQELFTVNSVGIVTARDSTFINDDKNTLKRNIKNFLQINLDNKLFHTISYRPFDSQIIYYDTEIIERPREKVMRHFLVGENIGLMVCRQQKTDGFYHCLIHNNIVESSYVSNKTSEIGYSFPLYLYPFDNTSERQPNLNSDIVKTIAEKINLRFAKEKIDDKKTFAPIDMLDYIYAVLHSPAYRTQYKEFLKIDFPRIPYPADAKQFKSLAELGARLRQIHLLENVTPSKNLARYPIEGSNTIDSIAYKDEKAWINKHQYFEAVPPEAWNFYIGGYQPAQKWLKDRKGRTLNFDEIQHYQKIVNALYLTGDIQRGIDKIYIFNMNN